MGIGTWFGSARRQAKERDAALGAALHAAGHAAELDRWNGWVFLDRGRRVSVAVPPVDQDWFDLVIEDLEGSPDLVGAPVIWNEEPGRDREALVDDAGAPRPELLLDGLEPVLAPLVAAGAFSLSIERGTIRAVLRTTPDTDAAAHVARVRVLLPTMHEALAGVERAYAAWALAIDP